MSASFTPLTWLADAARRGSGGDDPHGILAALDAFVAAGARGSLDDALGIGAETREAMRERRDALVTVFFDAFVRSATHIPPQHQRGAAFQHLDRYKLRHWEFSRGRVDGGHEPGRVDHLCWQIYSAFPQRISERWFRELLKKNVGSAELLPSIS
jgi:hypothetical protein